MQKENMFFFFKMPNNALLTCIIHGGVQTLQVCLKLHKYAFFHGEVVCEKKQAVFEKI